MIEEYRGNMESLKIKKDLRVKFLEVLKELGYESVLYENKPVGISDWVEFNVSLCKKDSDEQVHYSEFICDLFKELGFKATDENYKCISVVELLGLEMESKSI